MKRYPAILLMLVYTAFSAVAIAQGQYACSSYCMEESLPGEPNPPKAYHEHKVAGRREPPVLQQYHHNQTWTTSCKTLHGSHRDARRAASVPVHIRHCVFIL